MAIDPCAAYVSMLRARRLEDERTRKRRSERRADYLNANLDKYQAKERNVREYLMRCKLGALSQVESDVFDMLNEQAQWRHVMKANVENREIQRTEIDNEQRVRLEKHLDHVLEQERAAFLVGTKDDHSRHKSTKSVAEKARQSATREICQSAMETITGLTFSVIDFIEEKQVHENPVFVTEPVETTPFDRIPRPIFDSLKHAAVYGNAPSEAEARVVSDHVTLRGLATTLSAKTAPATSAYNDLLHALMTRVAAALYPPAQPLHPLQPTPQAYIVLVGPKFSGKSTAARAIAQELNLEYVSDTSVIAECLSALEGELGPQDVAAEETMDRLHLGREIRVVLQAGGAIEDDMLARLALFKIKHLPSSRTGIVFDGMPTTVAGFEIIETALSGFRSNHGLRPETPLLARAGPNGKAADAKALDVERPLPPPVEQEGKAAVATGKDAAKKPDPKAAAKKDNKKKEDAEEPLPPLELPPADPVPPLTDEEQGILDAATHDCNVAGLQRVIRIDCSADTLFDRHCGLRFDAETEVEYHVVTNPPPLERVPFVVSKDRSEVDTAKLHASIESDAQSWASVKGWLDVYAGLLNQVDGNVTTEALVSGVRAIVRDAVETAHQEFETLESAKSLRKERAELETLHAERSAHRDSVRKQLAAIYIERGVDPLPAELQDTGKAVAEDPLLPVPASTHSILANLLRAFQSYYERIVLRVHKEITVLLTGLYDYGVWATQEFDQFCSHPDNKQKLLDAFVKETNAMTPAMRRDVQGKEELHLRADTLVEALRAVVDKRRDEGHALVESLLAPVACLEPWCDGIRLLGSILVQLEVERFLVVRHIAATYYGGIKGDIVPFDDADGQVDVLIAVKSVEAAAALDANNKGPAGKDAKAAAKPPPKKGPNTAPPPEEATKVNEDLVAPMADKAVGAMKAVVDKLITPVPAATTAAPAKGGKAAKPAAEAPPVVQDGPSTASLCVPLVAAEFEAAKVRVAELAKFIRSLLERGVDRNGAVKSKLAGSLKSRVYREMASVNGCLYFLRSAIEEEAVINKALALDSAKFTIDEGRMVAPSSTIAPTSNASASRRGPSPTNATAPETITTCLNSKRAHEIIQKFIAIAPLYSVCAEDFANIVSVQDWSTGAGTPAPVDVVFKRFDGIGCGAIDWREFMVHLVLWSEPMSGGNAVMSNSGAFAGGECRNPLYIDGPTLLQLFDLKTDLGMIPLTYDQFAETELYFEVQVEPPRLAAIKDVLWETFAVADSLDPNDFVMFLCADDQPLRGVQKAFAMGAAVGDEVCNLTVDMLHRLLHYSACNCQAFGMEDKYSIDELQTLYVAAGVDNMNFQDMCAIGPGRVMLNNTTCFRRRKFTM